MTPDAIRAALELQGLAWLVLAVVAAGLVRGFAGFGSAMIMMPVASSVLPPFAAIAFLTVVELFGPLPNLPSALRTGSIREVMRLMLGAVLALPLGLWALSLMSGEVFGWVVSVIVLALLALLISGWRYVGTLSTALICGIGALGGFLSGVSGLAGPPVIMFYMASTHAIAIIRANFLLYLLAIDMVMILVFWVLGLLVADAVIVALMLVLPYMVANVIGARLFDPRADQLFRNVAYIIIATSAILGLPIWS